MAEPKNKRGKMTKNKPKDTGKHNPLFPERVPCHCRDCRQIEADKDARRKRIRRMFAPGGGRG